MHKVKTIIFCLYYTGPDLPGPQQLWGRPAFNHFGVRPTITVYGPCALNRLLPGFEPRVLPPSTLAEAH